MVTYDQKKTMTHYVSKLIDLINIFCFSTNILHTEPTNCETASNNLHESFEQEFKVMKFGNDVIYGFKLANIGSWLF